MHRFSIKCPCNMNATTVRNKGFPHSNVTRFSKLSENLPRSLVNDETSWQDLGSRSCKMSGKVANTLTPNNKWELQDNV